MAGAQSTSTSTGGQPGSLGGAAAVGGGEAGNHRASTTPSASQLALPSNTLTTTPAMETLDTSPDVVSE